MAIMRPSEFPESLKNQRDREGFVFEMLKKNLPADAVVIYEPLVRNSQRQNRKPDFVIFWPRYGCFVLEVKNWSRRAIESADDRTVYYKDEKSPRTNPYRSADSHAIAVQNFLQQRGTIESGLLQSEKEFKGRLSFPVRPGVLLLGTKENEITKWAELLCVDQSVLISEETLSDADALQSQIRKFACVFPGNHDAVVLRAAADLLREGSETEPSVDAASRSVNKLKQQLALPLVHNLETLCSHRKLLAVVAEDLATMISVDHEDHPNANNLLKLRDDLNQSRLRVGMFGTTAAGKSMLTNALVGKEKSEPDLVKSAHGRTTRVITRILPVDNHPAHAHRYSVLRYKTLESVGNELRDRLNDLGILDEELPDACKPINLADATHRDWLDKQIKSMEIDSSQDRDQSNALKMFLAGWKECHSLLGTEVVYDPDHFSDAESLIHGRNQSHASYVIERIIYHDNRLTEHGIELIDAPGVGAAVQDDDRALEIAQSADAFVIVTDVSFQFMQADRRFLRDAIDVNRGKRNNLLFVINQISKVRPDQCDPPVDTFDEAVDSQVDRFRATLSDYGVESATIWPVDAAAGKAARQMSIGKPNAEMRSFFDAFRFRDFTGVAENLKASRLEQLEENLIHHLTKHTYTDVMCDKVSRLEKEMAGYEDDLSARIVNIKRDIQAVQLDMEIHKKSRKRVRRELDGFFEKELPDQLREHEPELLEDIDHLVNFAIEAVIEKMQRSFKRAKSDLPSWINAAIRDASPKIENEIRAIRQKHENYWTNIREKALNEELPDILSTYGDGLSLDLVARDLDSAMHSRIEAMRGIQLGFFQKMFVGWWGAIIDVWNGDKEWTNYRSAIEDTLRKNYANTMREQFSSDVYKWICDDQDSLAQQTIEQFTIVMDNIESQINLKIDEIKQHEGDRDSYELRLKSFRDHAESILEDLRELREAIENHRPMEARAIA